MQPIIFNQVQDLILYSITIFAIGVWAGGAIVFKIATAIHHTKEHAQRISIHK